MTAHFSAWPRRNPIEMFEHDEPLLGEVGRRRQRAVLPYTAQVAEDPGVADRASGDDEAVEPGPFHQLESGGRIEDVAAADDRGGRETALDLRNGVPVGLAPVHFGYCASMNHEGIDPLLDGASHDLPEAVPRPGRMVHADAELHQNGAADGVPDRFQNVDRGVRVVEQGPAAAAAQNLGGRTGEIQVDEVVSGGLQVSGRPGPSSPGVLPRIWAPTGCSSSPGRKQALP